MMKDKLIEIISNFDGNSIIYTDYDSEPSITERGVEKIKTQRFKEVNLL